MSRVIAFANGLPIYEQRTEHAPAGSPNGGQFVSKGGGGGAKTKSKKSAPEPYSSVSNLAHAAHAATAKAHHDNTPEAHEAAAKAHGAAVEHLKKHGDGLDRKRPHEKQKYLHEVAASVHHKQGADKLSALAALASAHAEIKNTPEAHKAAQDAYKAAQDAYTAQGDEASASRHKTFGNLHAPKHKDGRYVKETVADKLSSTAKTPAELIAAAKAHYEAGKGVEKDTWGLEHPRQQAEYRRNAIAAHEALEKLETYPHSPNGNPIHPASWIEHHYGEVQQRLAPAQKKAVAFYTGDGHNEASMPYKLVNDALRKGETHKVVKDLDAALASAKTPEPITVRRTMLTIPPGMEVGAHFIDRGYMSTSLHHGGSTNFDADSSVHMEIHVPKGSPGLGIRSLREAHREQEEFLLPRNTKLRIDHIEEKDGKKYVKAAVVHDE